MKDDSSTHMNNFQHSIALLLIIPLLACHDNKQESAPAPAMEFKKLVWSDEFDQPGTPDATKWNYDLGDGCPNVCGWGNNELEYYTADSKNVRVENGNLIIEARKEDKGGKSYTSTRIVSKGKGDWLFGRIEVRAKLPRGKGTWPAIWMLSTDWKYGGWPASGEIDIMEHVGFDPGVVHGTIHTETYNHIKGTQKEGKVTMADVSDAFHVYGIEWTNEKMIFFIDDNRYFTVMKSPTDDFKGWPFDQRFHLIMNIAVGGNWGGMQGVDESIWPQRMEVDYVRVYQ
jgi:beta-glucanase (GH16 family)